MNTPINQNCGAVPPISHAAESADAPQRSEPTFGQYASFLDQSFEPAASDWSREDLAAMLLQELSYNPAGPDAKTEAIAHFRKAKKRAKVAIEGKSEDVHPDLARAIYFVSLARAWNEHAEWITKLNRESVNNGLAYIQECDWVKNNSRLVSRLTEVAIPRTE